MQYRVIVVAAKAESGCCSAPPPSSQGNFCAWNRLTPINAVVESTCNTMSDQGFVLVNLWNSGNALCLVFARP
jgi:hypothetical protein